MALSMYQASVPVFIRMLNNLAVILDKAEAHCTAHKIDPAALLQFRPPLSGHVRLRQAGAGGL